MTVMSHFFCVWEGVWIIELYLNRMMFVFLIPSFFYLDSTGMAWNGWITKITYRMTAQAKHRYYKIDSACGLWIYTNRAVN